MADSSDVDAAIGALLGTDAALRALLPDGVFIDVALPDSRKYVVITLMHHDDVYVFQETGWELFTYLIKAVDLNANGTTVKHAAARIFALMMQAQLTPPGYAQMRIARTSYRRWVEVDQSTGLRWQQRGGLYEVWMEPTTAP